MFEDTDWLAKLCYNLADIFRKLNDLNMSLQGKDTSILNLYDKVGGFLKKAEMWKKPCDQEDFTTGFRSYFTDMDETSVQLDWSSEGAGGDVVLRWHRDGHRVERIHGGSRTSRREGSQRDYVCDG
ncbi:uncharacterized protein LOC144988703 isoform X1 [Oryzias latipes]